MLRLGELNDQSERRFVVVGLVYLAVGVCCLWAYVFHIIPLTVYRSEFDQFQIDQRRIAHIRNAVVSVVAPAGDGKIPPSVEAVLKGIESLFPSSLFGRLQQFLSFQTEFERLVADARSIQREERSTSVSSQPTDTSTNADYVPSEYLYLAWLRMSHSDAYESVFARLLCSVSATSLTVKAFLLLGLSVGLMVGGFRLLKLSRSKHANARDAKFYLWPWATPVISLVVVLLLTGFGPVFAGPVDPATNKFLMVMTMAVALSPDQFVLAIRNYVAATLRSLTSDTGNSVRE